MKVFKSIDSNKVDDIKKVVEGLSKSEWTYIKSCIDMYFNEKAAKVKIDDLDSLDNYLKQR